MGDVLLSYKKASRESGSIYYNSVYFAIVDEPEIVEDFDFEISGELIFTEDVVRATAVDEEQRLYDVYWRIKKYAKEDGKFIEDSLSRKHFVYANPLTIKRRW